MSAKDIYVEAIEERLDLGDFHAAWPLGQDVSVGTIGNLGDDALRIKGHLKDFQPIEKGERDKRPDGLTYASGNGLKVEVVGDVEADAPVEGVGDVELSLKVTFAEKDQVALRATGVTFARARNERRLGERIIDAYWNKDVDIGDVFVSAFIQAESGAAAVSGEKEATLHLSGKGKLSAGPVQLGSLKSGIDIGASEKTSLEVPMGNGFVVAYQLLELVKEGLIVREPVVRQKRSARGVVPRFVVEADLTSRAD